MPIDRDINKPLYRQVYDNLLKMITEKMIRFMSERTEFFRVSVRKPFVFFGNVSYNYPMQQSKLNIINCGEIIYWS